MERRCTRSTASARSCRLFDANRERQHLRLIRREVLLRRGRQRLALRRRARRGRRRPEQLRRDPRPPDPRSTGRPCYGGEKPYYVPYTGTDLDDADTTATACRRGRRPGQRRRAERHGVSRSAASGNTDGRDCAPRKAAAADGPHPSGVGLRPGEPVQPVPAEPRLADLPATINGNTGAPFDDSPDWFSFN